MKKILILMLVASAPASAKVWNGCENSLIVEDGVYSHLSDQAGNFKCKVLFWPTKNPVALLDCDNEKYSTLEMVSNEKIYFDDIVMFSEETNKDACGVK